jgi:hypothetical protein
VKERLAHLVTYLFPRCWRDRYGKEFEGLLMEEPASTGTLLNVGWAALKERLVPTQALSGDQYLPSFGVVMKKPSAIIPVAMSLGALALVLVHIATAGIAPQADEGTAAHLWQLLMATQMPVLFFFAIKWLPKARRQALRVLALQVAAIVAAAAPVVLLKW